jgi:hypothetical protein
VYVGLSLFFTLLGFPNECLLGFLQGSIVGGLVGLVGVGLLPEWGVSFAMGFASVFLLLFFWRVGRRDTRGMAWGWERGNSGVVAAGVGDGDGDGIDAAAADVC